MVEYGWTISASEFFSLFLLNAMNKKIMPAKIVLGDYCFIANFTFVGCFVMMFFKMKLINCRCLKPGLAKLTLDVGF